MPEAPNTDVNTTPILHQEPTQQELSLQQETSHIRLVDKETALRMEKEEKGRWVTVSELIEEKKLPRMTVWNRIKRGKYVVTYDDKKCNRYGHQYLIWVPSIPFSPDAIPSAIPNDGAAIPFSPDAIPFSPDAIPSAIPNDTNIVKDEKENFRNYMRKLTAISKVNYVDEEEAQRMEEEGKGIWATIKEYAKAICLHESTVRKKIKKNKTRYLVTYDKKQTRHGHGRYMIWVTNPRIIEEIIEKRYEKQEKQLLKLIVTRPQLHQMHDQQIINEETFNKFIRENHTKYQLQILASIKAINNLWKSAEILEIKPAKNIKDEPIEI